MESSTAGLLGAFIGVSGSIAVNLLTNVLQTKKEHKKEIVSRYVEVIKSLASLQQSMEWIAWHGCFQPAAVDGKMIDDYSKSINGKFAELMAAVSIIAAYDKTNWEKLMKIEDETEQLDTIVANAIHEKNLSKRREIYCEGFKKIQAFYETWTESVAEMIRSV